MIKFEVISHLGENCTNDIRGHRDTFEEAKADLLEIEQIRPDLEFKIVEVEVDDEDGDDE